MLNKSTLSSHCELRLFPRRTAARELLRPRLRRCTQHGTEGQSGCLCKAVAPWCTDWHVTICHEFTVTKSCTPQSTTLQIESPKVSCVGVGDSPLNFTNVAYRRRPVSSAPARITAQMPLGQLKFLSCWSDVARLWSSPARAGPLANKKQLQRTKFKTVEFVRGLPLTPP
jgi:hypothetical protein